MKNYIDILKNEFQKAIDKAFATLLPKEDESLQAEVTQATQLQFGHYQCNSALKLAKELKKNPREVAQQLIDHFDTHLGSSFSKVEKLEIAGPGFINVFLNPSFIAEDLKQMAIDAYLGIDKPQNFEKVIVEFSSPNVAKELHVGHLRSTIIGDSLARVFEFLGYEVLRLNHIGDWGTQFGMLIAYLEAFHADAVKGSSSVDLPQLMHWYKESKKLFDADENFKKKSQLKVVDLQSGEPSTRKAWEKICDISRRAYQEIYRLMDVKLIERGESFYNPYLKEMVEDLEEKKLVTISDGAKCIFLEDFKKSDGSLLPLIIQKSDGGFNYATTDLAALKHRIFEEKADRIICVTDAGQSLHFQMVEKAGKASGFFDHKKVKFDHVPFGVVLGADGKKFKTRSGETEKLIDLLLEAVGKAREILKERIPDATEQELNESATILGIGAVKYADLSSHRLKDYTFSYDRMLKFEGNTAAFLLYAYVRCQSIKRKIGKDLSSLITNASINLSHPTEVALAIHLRQFGETLGFVAKELLPNRLADYLFTLAERFNAFFRDCRVEGDDKEDSRLLICDITSKVLSQGLNMLGLKTLERM